jgi:hypothetical protein
MCRIDVAVGSKAAESVAKVLGKNVNELDAMDGKKDGQINLYELARSNNHIVGPEKTREVAGECNMYLIDNGDDKVGEGDLFLNADGWYKESSEWAYRSAFLFQPRTVQKKPSDNSKDWSTRIEIFIVAAETTLKGKAFSVDTIEAAWKKAYEDSRK